MSSFDLSRIVESLQSSKVKSRNNSLSLLDGFQVPKLRLSSAQLASLIAALLRAIELEREVYYKQNNGIKSGNSASASRASSASGFLRDLVQESLKKPASSKSRPRLKTCISLINGILSLYYEPSSYQPFEPCSGSFADILATLFATPFVFTHLPGELWPKNYNFLLQAIAYELEYVGTRGPKENLINHLFCALFHMIGGPSTFGMIFLFHDHRYFLLLHILKKTLFMFNKRESPVLVVAFEIINNLLITFSTEDVGFVHQLIRSGLDVALSFATTSVTVLSEQILIFLNLDPFHRYLSLANIPKLVSVQETNTPKDSPLREDSSLITYNVKMLIGLLIQRLSGIKGLTPESVGLCDELKSTDWFHLPHIYMMSAENRSVWLLTTATSRLISSYYRIRQSHQPSFVDSTKSEHQATFASKSFSENSFKRQRLHERVNLDETNSPVEFLNIMITSDDPKAQTCGLQLLVFHYQLNDSRLEIETKLKRSVDHDDSTFLKVNLTLGESSQSRHITVIASCIKLMSDRRYAFWALMVCRSILNRSGILDSSESAFWGTTLHQLLKITLDLVKELPTCQLACAVFSTIVQPCFNTNLIHTLDATFMNQLENVIELSDILGPALISTPAVKFWKGIANMCGVLVSRKKPTLAHYIAKWLTGKWREVQAHSSAKSLKEIFLAVVQLLSWLDGSKDFSGLQYNPKPRNPEHSHFQATNNREELARFITMEPVTSRLHRSPDQIDVFLENSLDAAKSIIKALCDHPTTNAKENFAEAVPFLIVYVRFLGLVKFHFPENSAELEEKVHLLVSLISPKIQSKEQVSLLVSTTLLFNPSRKELQEAAFPTEVIEYYFHHSANTNRISENGDEEVLTDTDLQEFSQRSEPLDGFPIDKLIFFKFLLQYGHEKDIVYPRGIEASHIHDCVSFYLTLKFEEAPFPLAESILRLVGENLVSFQDYDRLDSTTYTACTLLETLFPLTQSPLANDLRKDTLDLVAYYFQCIEKKVLFSDPAISRVWNMLLKFTKYNDERVIANSDIMALFLDHLPGFSNNAISNVSRSLHTYISGLYSIAQPRLVDEVITTLSVPQSSVETSASFCLCLQNLTEGLDLDLLALGILAKFSRFHSFAAYSTRSIEAWAKKNGFHDSSSYFRSLRVDLLQSWWTNSQDLLDYPYQIFGYSSISDFIGDNAKHLIAVVFSTKCKPKQTKMRSKLVKTIVDLKSMSLASLTCDCLSTMIALSYTKSGIRDEVFDYLESILQNRYDEFLHDSLPLIILEAIMMTDMKSELVLKAAIGEPNGRNYLSSTEIIRSYNRNLIDPMSSVELILLMVEKSRRGRDENFWSLQIVFFLSRRVGLYADTKNPVAIKLALRRLQFILCLSRMDIQDSHLMSLLLSICLPMIDCGNIVDVMHILSQIKFEACISVSADRYLPIILNFLATTIVLEEAKRNLFRDIYRKIEDLGSEGGIFESANAIILSGIKYATGQKISLTITEVETFLSDDRISLSTSNLKQDVFKILSKILPFATQDTGTTASKILSKFFLEQPESATVGDKFQLWVSEYLAEFYLTGQANLSLEGIVLSKEYSGMTKAEMTISCKSLNALLQRMARELESGSYEQKAFLEIILGGFLNVYELKKREITKVFDFEELHEHIHPYVIPLSPELIPLLSEVDHNFKNTSANSFSNDFDEILSKLSFADWSSQLLCSLIQEILGSTAIAKILLGYASKMPDLAKHVLPNFLCYYIYNSGSNAAENVVKLFSGFWKCFKKPICRDANNLMKNIALCVRTGAMQNISKFTSLYALMNHKHLFAVVKESNSPKAALLFFEDSIAKSPQSLDWTTFRSPISGLYSSLNDEDSLSGIPADSSLEGSLILRHDFVQSAEKLRYNTGFYNADLILGKSPSPAHIINSLLDEGYLGISHQLNRDSRVSSSSKWSWQLNHWNQLIHETSAEKHDVTYAYFKQIRDSPSNSGHIYSKLMLKISSHMLVKLACDYSPRSILTKTESWLESLALIKTANDVFKSNPNEFLEHTRSFNSKTNWFHGSDTHSYENILLARRLAFALHESSPERAKTLGFLSSEFFRVGSFSSAYSKNQQLCLQGEVGEIVRYNNLLRDEGMLQKTINSSILLERIVRLESGHEQLQEMLQKLSSYQTAQTLWLEGKMDLSVSLLARLAGQGDIAFELSTLNVSKEILNAQLAVWLAESRSDLGSNILHRVVEPIMEKISLVEDVAQQSKIYHLLASFCESQFKSNILKEQFVQLDTRVKAKQDEVLELKTHYGRSGASASERSVARHYYEDLKNQIRSESEELLNLKELRISFVHNAVIFYLKALQTGISSDEDLDKFFSLFLEFSGDESLQYAIKDELFHLPSRKPLTWCTQILSRVSQEVSVFQESVQQLLFRVCLEHPYHSLYYLTSLLFHENLAKETVNASMLSRVTAATQIRKKLLASGSIYATSYLTPIEKLCVESVSLAEVKSSKGKSMHLDKLKIGRFWMNELPRIPPPTLQIEVCDGGYHMIPFMEVINPQVFIAATGISLPKVVTILLSNGKPHKMLLKHGADDLRQDAIMEQVFQKMNKIFGEDKQTRKRKLRVRTYSAVPLGPKAGVIEFVPDSKSLFDVIQPLHQIKDFIRLDKAREMMKNSQTKSHEERLRVYRNIEEKIRPVLKQYFMANFVTPDDWFASRQIYIRGVATSSMVGHILGLGDRHCNNILLDQFTGEPIHIDLGVAFDQGKRLKVPETVPFRLTRDMVDAFGYMSTAGPFTKVGEHTLRVLRTSREHILAMLDVLRWDPLYSWSISPIKKRKLQEENAGGFNSEAKQDGSAAGKAILGVSEKLNAGGLSVEAAVRELIREATSEYNLAVIYCGWCPFY